MNADPKDKSARRRIVAVEFLTFDGVMQAPGGRDEDMEQGFQYGGWQMEFPREDGDGPDLLGEYVNKSGALLLGRKTYENFAAYWPGPGKDIPGWGAYMNQIPKYVASKTLEKAEWQNSTLLKGDAAESVARLKEEAGKDIYIIGSGNLCQSLMRHGLIDEYFLMIYPMVLGTGKRLFPEGCAKQDLELVKSYVAKNGVLWVTYNVKN